MIPNELRGKKAVPFLELIKEKVSIGELLKNELIDFYSLPFDVSMLVNQCKVIKDSPYWVFGDGEKEYNQAEEKRLFEGITFDGNYYYIQSHRISHSNKPHTYLIEGQDGKLWEFHTLNDFITLCNLAKVNLQFKK